jgi:CIC family chloride channel protein
MLALSLVVGAGAGIGAIIFRWLILAFTRLFTGYDDYSGVGHAPNPHVPWLGPYFVVLAPVVAGLLYGPLVHFFAREAKGHGVPEVMYAVSRRGGRIAPRVAVVKALASALCMGGGGSVGREGPIVQIGSALGSTLGQITRLPEERLRVLVACGAAGGIAATFNAPLAGVFFAMEIILVDFAARSFGMVVLSSVTASVIGRAAFGDDPFLSLPSFHVAHLHEFLLFGILGLMAGGVGVLFTKTLYAIEDVCDRLWRWPEWARPAVGGILLGLVLLVLPQMYGVGYPVLGAGVRGEYAVGFLLVLLVGKVFATSLTMGIGGSGGVFAPSLFIGGMLGAAFGETLHAIEPGLLGPVGAYALIGMGAVFAGAARAPITAVVIMFELTSDYGIILPLMTAIVLAAGLSHHISPDTIYTLKLRRRGIDLSQPNANDPMAAMAVGDVMAPVPRAMSVETSLIDAAGHLARSGQGVLPVVAEDGTYRGTVTARAVAEALTEPQNDVRPVGSLTEMPDAVLATSSLEEAVGVLDRAMGSAVPVLDDDRKRLVGWLSQQTVLRTVRRTRNQPAVGTPVPSGANALAGGVTDGATARATNGVPGGAASGGPPVPAPAGRDDEGTHEGADDAARLELEAVTGEQAGEETPDERADEAGDDRHGPVDLAVLPPQDELRAGADDHAEEDESDDEHGT